MHSHGAKRAKHTVFLPGVPSCEITLLPQALTADQPRGQFLGHSQPASSLAFLRPLLQLSGLCKARIVPSPLQPSPPVTLPLEGLGRGRRSPCVSNEAVEAEGGTLLSEVPELRLGGVGVGAWAGPCVPG